jgi:hypothetical protein
MATAALLALLVAAQVLVGAYWWALVLGRRRPVDLLEALGGGLALGALLAVACGAVTSATLGSPVGVLAPAALTALHWLVSGRRHSWRSRLTRPSRAATVATALGLAAGLVVLLGSLRRAPLDLAGASRLYHQDMFFFEALANSLARLGPLDSAQLAGSPVRYHWLAYGWAGQLSALTDAPSFVVLTRVLPVVALVGVTVLAASWAARLSRVRWVPTLAVLLVVVGGAPLAQNNAILNFDSPSAALSAVWLLALLIACLRVMADGASASGLVLVAGLTLATTASKGSAGVVATVGVGLVALATLWPGRARSRVRRRTAWSVAATVAATALLATVALVMGSEYAGGLHLISLANRASTGQGIDPGTGSLAVTLGIAALALTTTNRWAGAAWLGALPAWRVRPEAPLALGLALGGLAPLVLFSHGTNETWFALSASAPLGILSAAGLGEGWRAHRRRGWAVGAVGVAVATTVASVGVLLLADPATAGVRWFLALLPLLSGLVAAVACSVAPPRPGLRSALPWLVLTTVLVTSALLARAPLQVAERRQPERAAATAEAASRDGSAVLPITADRQAGLRFLREHVGPSELVLTTQPTDITLPAVARVLTYTSGQRYLKIFAPLSVSRERLAHQAALESALTAPSANAAELLCEARISWVWRPAGPGTADIPGAAEAYANDTVRIDHVDSRACR